MWPAWFMWVPTVEYNVIGSMYVYNFNFIFKVISTLPTFS